MMENYIFLDAWALSLYTKKEREKLLSRFVLENDYTILINSATLVEAYNSGWRNANGEERMQAISRFLSKHRCAFIYPENVFGAEIRAFPNTLNSLPVDLNLHDVPADLRGSELLKFFREDASYVGQGKNVREWFVNLNATKARWLNDVNGIIEDACQKNVLLRNDSGEFIELQERKEKFLVSLDRRHFTEDEIQQGGKEVIELFLEETSRLPAVRMSSLCFWHEYIELDKAFPMAMQGSDIADHYQISLIPYCKAFTVDKNMFRLVNRILKETDYSCNILNPSALEQELARS